jgi:hypothetical protein
MSEKLSTYTPLEIVVPELPDQLGAYTVNAEVDEDGKNYTTIQAAVNAIPTNSVLYITNGYYAENITWNKKLSVIGLGGDNFQFIYPAALTPDVVISGEQTIGASVRFYSIYFKRETVGQTSIKSGAWLTNNTGDANAYFTRCGFYTESIDDYSITNTFDYTSDSRFNNRVFQFHDCYFNESGDVATVLAIILSKYNQIICINTRGFGEITINDKATIVITNGTWNGIIDGTNLQSGAKGFTFTADTADSTILSNISDFDNARLTVGDTLTGSGIIENTKIVTINSEGTNANTVVIDTETNNTEAGVIIQSISITNNIFGVSVVLTDAIPDTLTGISDVDIELFKTGDVVTGTYITLGSTVVDVIKIEGNNAVVIDSGLIQNDTINVIPTSVRGAVFMYNVITYSTDQTVPFIKLNDDNWVTVYNCEFNKQLNGVAVIELNSGGVSTTARLRYSNCRFNGQNLINRNGGAASINSILLDIDDGV